MSHESEAARQEHARTLIAANQTIVQLRAQVAALTQERDEALISGLNAKLLAADHLSAFTALRERLETLPRVSGSGTHGDLVWWSDIEAALAAPPEETI